MQSDGPVRRAFVRVSGRRLFGGARRPGLGGGSGVGTGCSPRRVVHRACAGRLGKTGFTRLDPAATGLSFTNRVSDLVAVNNQIIENGAGVALGDVDGDGRCDVYLCGAETPNRLYRNLGDWHFENITASAGVACDGQFSTGAVLADVDGDGDLDLLVNGLGTGTRLFRNEGRGKFTEDRQAGLHPTGAATSASLADIANITSGATAESNRPLWGPGNWNLAMIVDGDTANAFHLDQINDPGAEYVINLGQDYAVSDIKIYPRQDGCCADRLRQIRVSIHGDDAGSPGAEVWGTDLFTDGSNAGSAAGTVVDVPLPAAATGRYVKIHSLEDPVPAYALQLAEVQVFANVPASQVNRAVGAPVFSNHPLFSGNNPSHLADGIRSGRGNDISHGEETIASPAFYTVDLGTEVDLSRIVIWARQDGAAPERLSNYRVSVHKDNAGAIGDEVWKADLHTDGSNPGADPGSRDIVTAASGAGVFKGRWLKILALDDPVPSYALQIVEIEAYGEPVGAANVVVTSHPKDTSAGVGQTARFEAAVLVAGGDASQVTYQWQRNDTDIPGATASVYVTPPVLIEDDGAKYRCVIRYPGLANIDSDPATLRVNLAFQTKAYTNRPLWAPGGWNINLILDGDRNGPIHGDQEIEPGMAYEIDLGADVKLDEVDIYPRQDTCCVARLANFRVSIHKNNNGQIGDSVWQADFFTGEGENAGGGSGSGLKVLKNLDPTGTFQGQWIRILALGDPVPSYFLQMTEVEAFGAYTQGPALQIASQPTASGHVPGRPIAIGIGAKIVNGDPSKLSFGWFKNGDLLPNSDTNRYTTAPLTAGDDGAVFTCKISYPGLATLTSEPAVLKFDYNYAAGQPATASGPLWGPGGWNISMLVDGNRDNVFHADTAPPAGFHFAVDLGTEIAVDKIDIYPRQDGAVPERFSNVSLTLHKDDNGQPGAVNWQADLFTDGSNPGAAKGTVVTLLAADGTGEFKGRWARLQALDDPVKDYWLQLTELEVYGKATAVPPPTLSIGRGVDGLTITYTGGVLESVSRLGDNWAPVVGAASPYKAATDGAAQFYRVKQ